MRREVACLIRVAIAIAGVAFAPAIAAADCARQTGLEITVDRALQSEGWCVSGALTAGIEHSVNVSIDAPGLWQVELEALPGQIGVAVLVADNTELWEGFLGRDGTIVSPSLLLAAGDYRIALATAEGMMVYRVRLTPAAPLPAAVPTAVTDAFAGRMAATAGEIAIPWTVGASAPGALWTISAQSPIGGSLSITLRDATGTTVTWSNIGDEFGVYALPDIALAPGEYELRVSGPPEGTPILLAATNDLRPPGFAAEPDGLPETGHPIAVDTASIGRLASGGLAPDDDFFALDIAAGTPIRLYDLSVIAPSDAELRVALTNDQRDVLFERSGARQVYLRGLALGPGRHFFRVNGSLPPDVTYTLLVEEAGEAIAGAEVEPNDAAAQATPLPAAGPVVGAFVGTDYDYIELGVAGEMQLWDIEATGLGLTAVTLYDGAGQVIATTGVAPGARVARLSRILLPPGRNLVRLDGAEGSWLLRSTPRGLPLPGEEVEPNDEQSRALALAPDLRNIGWLDRARDGDMYAFHLEAPHRVRLTIEGPADFPLLAQISWGDASNRIAEMESTGAAGEPQRLVWEGLLPTGDFIFEIWAYGGATREPYALTLEFPSFHDRPADLEPNNDARQASALPAGAIAAGVIQGGADNDWFALDPALGPGPVVIRAEMLTGLVGVLVARGDPAAPETIQQAYFYAAGETLTVDLTGEPGQLLRIDGTPGPYEIAVGPARPPTPPEAMATLVIDTPIIAAFEPVAQTIAGTLTIQSESKGQLTLAPLGWIGDERWRFVDLPPTIALPAGGRVEIPIEIEIPADVLDGAVRVEIAFAAPGVQPVVAAAAVEVAAGAPPVGAYANIPLPPAMLGGLNVAWSAVGGAIDDPAQAALIDTVVDVAGVTLYADAVVRLAGGNPVRLSGVVLELPPAAVPSTRLAAFAIELSLDGANFERVLEGHLSPRAGEQAFVFDTPREAVAARLVPLSVQSGEPDRPAVLAEFKVVADPAFTLDPAGFDIALPVLGGHVVRQAGIPDHALTGEAAEWPIYAVPTPTERTAPPEWVFGFLHGRAAQIASVIWYPRTDVQPEEQIQTVEVLASVAGPLGPFESLGVFTVDPASPQPLPLAEGVWARALLFRGLTPSTGRVYLPDHIEIREGAGPSVLGEWGALGRGGPYEAQLPPADLVARSLPPVSTDQAAPTPLTLGAVAEGQVRRGETEHWYAIDLPEGTLGLRAEFAQAMAPDVALTLFGADGQAVELVPDPDHPGEMTINAAPGRWLLRVVQPTASVVVAWDTSLSVSSFYPSIARMVRQLGNDLDPMREEINLLPFRGDEGQFLMDNWSGNPGAIYAALHAYPLRDTSSDAESALLFAAQQLAGRVGSRAVVIVTDASYYGVYKNEALWRSLGDGGVRVFALYLPADYDPARAQAQLNLMSDWAGAAGGHVSRFASQGDSDAAFRRVAAWLARPADYAFTLTADTTPPEPGRLVVALAERGGDGVAAAAIDGAPPVAMAIVLDASGSMLQRLGDRTRIDIAKDVLRRLGSEILPEGLPVALRVFGNDQPGSCENELFLPLAPLDRPAFAAAVDRVQSVNLARTSIAATLRAAAGDLADAAGSRVIVLITDGQETCGGDPLAEIAALRAAGIDIRLNIVGFAIDDPATRALFETWAAAGAGAYFDAGDQAALGAAIEGATALPFAVLDAAGTEVATGVIGGAAVELPPGRYRLRTGMTGQEQEVVIRPGEEQRVAIGGM